MPTNYRDTLNLPQTDFPMKADLVQKEPVLLKKWADEKLYEKVLEKNKSATPYILHDGPPYANGNIHFGHILNKVLKDIIIKYKNMSGFRAPYVPGWDCHGLPIEHQVDRELGANKKNLSRFQIRQKCREYALKYVGIQREDFKRLGVLGNWENPYLTLTPDYEAAITREFGRFVERGNVYKALRPVLWCGNCQTALADAETEYEEKESPSIYVRFQLHSSSVEKILPSLKDQRVSIVIWTTTPWTLPANLAVAVHENYDYVVVRHNDEYLIVAKQLVDSFSKVLKLENTPEVLERFSGKKLEGLFYHHPFLEPKNSPRKIVLSDHVTMDTGTGCVHIAPGHGEEDYEVGLRYSLEIVSPVNHQGRLTEEAGLTEISGLKVLEANPKILEVLEAKGALLHHEKIRHMYPHCWRCKNPLIFRATEQYFLSLEKNDLRAKALDAIRRAEWIPSWGRERIYGMIEKRRDWCLSRQRSWGVPIVAFRCAECRELLLDSKLIEKTAQLFEKETSDIWFDENRTEELLPKDYACSHCQNKKWVMESHILDVWFDSGVSFAAVLEKRPELKFPADLYLEGSDQHRGWFHSSLLASVGTREKAPYLKVLTHGFVVDSNGKKYSKSAGNYVPPEKILNENGAEILRLWVAAEDYRNDIRVSKEILTRLVEAYRKIRNTCRFLLGNLHDFDPTCTGKAGCIVSSQGENPDSPPNTPHRESSAAGSEIDRWALHHLQKLTSRVLKAYESFNFHTIFHELNRFCTVELSAFYLDILKDRLYTKAKNDPSRVAAQRVLFEIVSTLARLMAPILSFTSEEIWQHIPAYEGKEHSVHLTTMPTVHTEWVDESLSQRWEELREIREEVLKALEQARQNKTIGNSLEAKLTIFATEAPLNLLKYFDKDLSDLLQVSQIEWTDELGDNDKPTEKFSTLFLKVEKAGGSKCERCWRWSTEVGNDKTHATLCERCVPVMTSL